MGILSCARASAAPRDAIYLRDIFVDKMAGRYEIESGGGIDLRLKIPSRGSNICSKNPLSWGEITHQWEKTSRGSKRKHD
jgi:hypothetical protein